MPIGPGSPGQPIPPPKGKVYDAQSWGGYRGVNTNGNVDSENSGFQNDLNRYEAMGRTGNLSTQIYQGASDQARGEQNYALGQTKDAMGLARDAAYGNAPSAAEIYGQRMLDDSINSQMGMAASASGGPSSIAAAQRQAAFQGAQTQQAGARDLAAMRAQEMAQARDQYLGAANTYAGQAGAMRGQDIGVATSQAQLDDANQARQQQNQQFYEQMGWNTKKQQQDAALQQEHERNNFWLGRRGLKQEQNRDDWGKIQAGIGAGASFVGGMFSDIRAKENVVPVAGGGIIRDNPYGGPGSTESATAQWERSFGPRSNAVDDARKHDNQVEAQKIRANFEGGAAPAGGGAQMFGGGMAALGRFGGGAPSSGGGYGARLAYQPLYSDERAKTVYIAGARADGGPVEGGQPYLVGERGPELYVPEGSGQIVPLGDTSEGQLRSTPEGRAYYERPLEAPEPHPAFASKSEPSKPATKAAAKGKARTETRKWTDDELMREADRMKGQMQADHDVYMARGPAADPMADANRAQAGSMYTYKPDFAAASGQAPGETNVGPMAQTMAADPLASTAVSQDPQTGMLTLDRDKLSKLQSAGIASLQQQLDNLYAQRGGY